MMTMIILSSNHTSSPRKLKVSIRIYHLIFIWHFDASASLRFKLLLVSLLVRRDVLSIGESVRNHDLFFPKCVGDQSKSNALERFHGFELSFHIVIVTLILVFKLFATSFPISTNSWTKRESLEQVFLKSTSLLGANYSSWSSHVD